MSKTSTPKFVAWLASVAAVLAVLASVPAAFAETEKVYGTVADLQAAKAEYEKYAKKNAWKPINSSKTLELGATGTAPEALRKRLAAEGYKIKRSGIKYDAKLEAVVKEFQRRNGIVVDGKAGPDTYEALNVTPAERVKQIEVNIKRRQEQLERAKGEMGILVNLADQRLHAFNPKGEDLSMKVVVGKSAWETPEMRERIEYIVVNPYWNIPIEIVDAELVWEVKNNPNYLDENDMEVVEGPGPDAKPVSADKVDWDAIEASDPSSLPYLIRRKPGPQNPMGLIKFMLPNRDDIYLHDTPADHLFDETFRDLSHGCIRLEKPLELAGFIGSRAEGWSQSDFQKAIDSGEQEIVQVEPELAVDLVYWTAWVEDGVPHFREDIYGRD